MPSSRFFLRRHLRTQCFPQVLVIQLELCVRVVIITITVGFGGWTHAENGQEISYVLLRVGGRQALQPGPQGIFP